MASDENEADSLRRRVADLEAELTSSRDRHRIELEHERLRHQEHSLGLIIEGEASHDRNRLLGKRISRLRDRLDEATKATELSERRERELRAELDGVYASRTWRAGRVLLLRGRAR